MFIVNALPFVGFGFLDNFLMIIMGDYIEGSIGIYFHLSTMAAAALGNTISDVLGLGLAHYVEQFCVFLGMESPDLTPTQQNMPITQRIGTTVSIFLNVHHINRINSHLTFFVYTGSHYWHHNRMFDRNVPIIVHE